MKYYAIRKIEQGEKFYETDNRAFEQFAHDHLINFVEQRKDEKTNRTVWVYLVTDWFRKVHAEFNSLAM